jgi:EAL domain-containing protein (putative c-di-GMP-specific phosphodiesterase class I)
MKGKSSLKPTGHETVPQFYNRQGLLASFSQEEAVSGLCNRCMNARPPIKGSPLRECSGFAPESPEERILSSIRPHFQPIVTSHRHSIYAVEALLRLLDVSTSRDILFRRWEATGEVVDIDMMMVRRVLSAIRTASSPPHTIGVNVSALTEQQHEQCV